LSYILDALKKADAERERSAVPGLHAHPQDDPAGRERREGGLPWPAIAVTAIVLLAAALGWLLWSERGVRLPPLVAEAAPPADAPAPISRPAPVTETPAPPATQAAAPPTPAPAPVAAPEPAPTPAPTTPAPATAAAPAPRAPATATTPPPVTRSTPAPAPAPAKPPAPAEPPVPPLAALPADVRAGLPPLNISGAVFSPTPSARMLFINGQVLREGDAVADGVVVERIGASASVLSARGARFEIKH
jgi:general secretion pathway protein B